MSDTTKHEWPDPAGLHLPPVYDCTEVYQNGKHVKPAHRLTIHINWRVRVVAYVRRVVIVRFERKHRKTLLG